MPRYALCFVFGMLMLGRSHHAWSQAADTLAYSLSLDDVVVTAQPVPLSARDALHDVQVLTQVEIRKRGYTRLSEVLERELTLAVRQDPILGVGFSVQGLGGQNVQILIDGMPIVGRLGGNVDLSQIDLSEIVRIEIVSGALNAQYGSAAAGGVINLITRREQESGWRGNAEAQSESVGIRYGSAGLGWQRGRFQLGAGANIYEAAFATVEALRERQIVELSDGSSVRRPVVPWNPKDQFGWRANLAYRISDSLRLDYRVRGFGESLTLFGEVRRPQFRPYVLDQGFRTQRLDHQVLLEGHLNRNLYLSATAGYNQFDRFRSMTRLDLDPDTTSVVPGQADTTRYTALLSRVNINYQLRKGLALQGGLEGMRETGAGGRILDTLTGEEEPAIDNIALWLGTQFELWQGLEVGVNTRVGYNSRYRHPVIPGVHLKYDLGRHWQARASYARGFRAPSVQEMFFQFIDVNHYIVGNADLGAERSGNTSVSLQYSQPFGKTSGRESELELGLRAYHNEVQDRITLFEFAPARFSYGNIDRFRSRGAVLNSGLRNWHGLDIQAGVGWMQISSGFERSESAPAYVSSVEANALLAYRIPKLLIDVRVDHRFFGRQVRFLLDADGNPSEQTIAPYHLMNIALNRNFLKDRLTLQIGIKDVFDVQDVAIAGNPGGGAHSGGSGLMLVGFGRNYFSGLRLNF